MSCAPGKPCEEGKKRRIALLAFGLMALVFFVLSAFSFVDSRVQVTPEVVTYGPYNAVQGKRVFQAYNCMDCHTIVGNGAYFAPDLTKEYQQVGPAWLAAFLGSPGSWPTQTVVAIHLHDPAQLKTTDIDTMQAYLKQFPGAAQRIRQQGGHGTYMPNLTFSGPDIGKLIAFLKYTSDMNTEGWPPKPETNGAALLADRSAHAATAVHAPAGAPPAAAASAQPASDPAVLGAKLVQEDGCTACHATDQSTKVGPGWGGLYNSQVKLTDGSTVTANDAYLARSILDPNAQIPTGFQPNIMPANFGSVLSKQQVDAIVAYIKTLKGNK
ncbi:MAG: cytochrome c [Rhodanobacteraceae bacterium]|nr:MAG: cytochrome c [Rhodanobacteraceae bacterium]